MNRSLAEGAPRETSAMRFGENSGKYLAFHLGDEEFGIEVMKVREIIGLQEVTAVPHTPDYVRGVINLRGKVIPVLDLRRKLGLEASEQTQSTCIIVVQVSLAAGNLQTGVVVDGVSEVLTVATGDIEAPPEFGKDVLVHHVLGIAKVRGKVKILLDIDRVLSPEDTKGVLEAAASIN